MRLKKRNRKVFVITDEDSVGVNGSKHGKKQHIPPTTFKAITYGRDSAKNNRSTNNSNSVLPSLCVDVEEVGELTSGDIFGHHAMRLSLPHACSVIATEPCQFYTLSFQSMTNMLKERPEIAFEFQSALGKAIFDVEKRVCNRYQKREKLHFLEGIKSKFEVCHQTNGVKINSFPELIKKLTKASSDEEKQYLRSEFYKKLEIERQKTSKFRYFYHIRNRFGQLLKIVVLKKSKIVGIDNSVSVKNGIVIGISNDVGGGVIPVPTPTLLPTTTITTMAINPIQLQLKVEKLNRLQKLYDSYISVFGIKGTQDGFERFCNPDKYNSTTITNSSEKMMLSSLKKKVQQANRLTRTSYDNISRRISASSSNQQIQTTKISRNLLLQKGGNFLPSLKDNISDKSVSVSVGSSARRRGLVTMNRNALYKNLKTSKNISKRLKESIIQVELLTKNSSLSRYELGNIKKLAVLKRHKSFGDVYDLNCNYRLDNIMMFPPRHFIKRNNSFPYYDKEE